MTSRWPTVPEELGDAIDGAVAAFVATTLTFGEPDEGAPPTVEELNAARALYDQLLLLAALWGRGPRDG